MSKIVGIIGKGSIGLRHSRLLKKLGFEIIFIRRSKSEKQEISFDDLKLYTFKFFIICNPTILHLNTLKKLIKFKLPILVEKPLFHKINNSFLKKIQNHKHLIFTAYQMRFDPRLIKIKSLIKKKKNLYSNFIWHTYMPEWHKNENYLNSYASRKELGGGAILTLSHEIDMAIYLLGEVKEIKYVKLKNNLKINVEDKLLLQLKHKNNSISNLHLNFSTKCFERSINIFSNSEKYSWDFNKKYITINSPNKEKKIKFNFLNDEIYFFQIKNFLKTLKNKKYNKSIINFQNTIHTQKVIDQIKKLQSLKN